MIKVSVVSTTKQFGRKLSNQQWSEWHNNHNNKLNDKLKILLLFFFFENNGYSVSIFLGFCGISDDDRKPCYNFFYFPQKKRLTNQRFDQYFGCTLSGNKMAQTGMVYIWSHAVAVKFKLVQIFENYWKATINFIIYRKEVLVDAKRFPKPKFFEISSLKAINF